MFFRVITGLVLTINLSCSHYGSINKKVHRFIDEPQKVIWYHVPGLHEAHISILKFFYRDTSIPTAFEKSTCMGKMWRYNLYEIRPDSRQSFLSQISGTKNITNTCNSYSYKPMWSYMRASGYFTAFLENETQDPNYSLLAPKCEQNRFRDDIVWWKMARPTSKSKTFHIQEEKDYKPGNVYFDKSCTQSPCFNDLMTNTKNLISRELDPQGSYFFLVSDSSLLEAIDQNNLKAIKTSILKIESMVDYLYQLQEKNPDMLVMITSSDPVPVELPSTGKEWKSFINGRNNLVFKNSSILSPVWAKGVRAENFCGMYEEAEVLQRVMNNYTNKRLELFGIPLM